GHAATVGRRHLHLVAAEHRHLGPAQAAGGAGGELGREVAAGGEPDPRHVLGADGIDRTNLGQQVLGRLQDGGLGVGLGGGRAPNPAHRHQRASSPRTKRLAAPTASWGSRRMASSKALATMAPSATPRRACRWAGRDRANPTTTGSDVWALTDRTSGSTAGSSWSRAPVTPVNATQ